MNPQDVLKQTPLHSVHHELKARMIPFGGWDMPVQYEGILAEYDATRKTVAAFDTSHMGQFYIKGDVCSSGLDKLVTCNLIDLPVNSCRYGVLLNEKGGVMDDLIVFRMDQEDWFIVVNGATTDKDAAQFQQHITSGATFQNISMKTGKIDVQGPQARDLLKPIISGIEKLEFYKFDLFDVLGEKVIVSRTGYTGELGYEIYYPWDKTAMLWKEIFKLGDIKPAGLGARDILRLEMGYSLYGHELSDEISPLEAGLKRFVDMDKEFIGKEALIKQQESGIKRKIVAFTSESRRSPRLDQKLFNGQEEEIGIVTSGSFSPQLQVGIGLGLVSVDSASKDDKIFFGDERGKNPAVVSSRPFFKGGSLKN